MWLGLRLGVNCFGSLGNRGRDRLRKLRRWRMGCLPSFKQNFKKDGVWLIERFLAESRIHLALRLLAPFRCEDPLHNVNKTALP